MRLKFLTYMWIILDMCAVYIEHNEYESEVGDLYMKIVQLRDNICESAEKIKPGSCIEEEWIAGGLFSSGEMKKGRQSKTCLKLSYADNHLDAYRGDGEKYIIIARR